MYLLNSELESYLPYNEKDVECIGSENGGQPASGNNGHLKKVHFRSSSISMPDGDLNCFILILKWKVKWDLFFHARGFFEILRDATKRNCMKLSAMPSLGANVRLYANVIHLGFMILTFWHSLRITWLLPERFELCLCRCWNVNR